MTLFFSYFIELQTCPHFMLYILTHPSYSFLMPHPLFCPLQSQLPLNFNNMASSDIKIKYVVYYFFPSPFFAALL